jgi:hypothetical protein
MPLSSKALCDAEIMIAPSQRRLRMMYETPGVGSGPVSSTRIPTEHSPAVSAFSIM